jgi:ABC-type multidrug transport system fused ATPase/permease subunit
MSNDLESHLISNDRQDIINAAIASNAHNFITAFTDGYDTDVGEGSVMVSGGQKQRIAIARALVKNPCILLFDEATSALDSVSEKMVQESIDQIQQSRGQTILIIAHRLTTIVKADKIVVTENGSIVDIGKHEELLARNELYCQLWAHQNSSSDEGRICAEG